MKDHLQYLKTLSIKRLLNLVLLTASYIIAKVLKKPIHWGLPASISIEPTTACNLGCPECPSGIKSFTRNTGNLSLDFYQQVLDQISASLTYVIFYFQGEPFINTKLLEMIRYAKSKHLYTATSTNAHFLHDELARKTVESGLDRLIISIDGTTQEVYESYRKNGKLSKVIEGTKNVVKWKKELKSATPYVVFQFLVVKPNEHQLEDVKALGKEIGVNDVWLKTAQIYDYEKGNPLIPTLDKYSRYKKQADGTYTLKNKLVNSCWKMWHSCVVTWDGLIVPCCFDKDAKHQLGDMSQQSFHEIWRNAAYRHFRGQLLNSRSEIDICKNCSEGTKVWG